MATKKPRKTTDKKTARPRSRKGDQGFNWSMVGVFLLGAALAAGLTFAGLKYFGGPQQAKAPAKTQQQARQAQAPQGAQPQPPAAQQAGQPQTAQTGPQQAAQQPGQQATQPQAQQAQTQQTGQQAAPAQAQQLAQQPQQPQQAPPKGQPLLAIVIDDLGGSLSQAQAVAELKLTVTASALPGLARTKEVDALLAKAGIEIILHQPMEPKNASEGSPGPGAITQGMAAKDVARVLEANLAQTPHAVGVNNHMGSKATEDQALMAAFMATLKGRNLVFLDSKTTERSVADKEAAKAGVPVASRAVFIDNERGQQAALLMLREAERVALTKGRAVAIGHPHPETLAALAAWEFRRDQRVRLVSLTKLIRAD